jgi:hypothetical protein
MALAACHKRLPSSQEEEPTKIDTRNLAVQAVSKVPEVTFGFWVIGVIETTLGETGGDRAAMSLSSATSSAARSSWSSSSDCC